MSEQSRNDLKNDFVTGNKVTEQKMHSLLDSFVHKSDDTSFILRDSNGVQWQITVSTNGNLITTQV